MISSIYMLNARYLNTLKFCVRKFLTPKSCVDFFYIHWKVFSELKYYCQSYVYGVLLIGNSLQVLCLELWFMVRHQHFKILDLCLEVYENL